MLVNFNTKTSIPADKVLCIKQHEGKVFVHVAPNLFFEVTDTLEEAQAKFEAASPD